MGQPRLPGWLRGAVGRREYLIAGAVLFAIKYPIDVSVAAAIHADWSLLSYLTPRLGLRPSDPALFTLWSWLLIASLPFMAIGAWFTARRLLDAGGHPAWALLFFAPLVNLPFLVVMATLPTKRVSQQPGREAPYRSDPPPVVSPVGREPLIVRLMPRSTGMAFVVSTLATLAVTIACVRLAQANAAYVIAVFTLVPVINGAIVAAAISLGKPVTTAGAFGYAMAAMVFWSMSLLVTGAEGIGCLVMALPAVVPMVLIGVSIGLPIGRRARPQVVIGLALLLAVMPPVTAVASTVADPFESQVETTVHVNASPAEVWRRVVSFPPIGVDAKEPFFELGYPVPVAARIDGEGVGAVRRCIFDQGEFVEPITAWEPDRHLAFGVSAQPASLPHWLTITRGEFILREAADGGTILIGRTYYRAGLAPAGYWELWIQWGLRSVHERVLGHITHLVEASRH